MNLISGGFTWEKLDFTRWLGENEREEKPKTDV